ncbi:MAG: hypothetical protein Q8P51_01510 [Ignavibacteria bacterium]|nr:hypothetical protein [Ignavibacteria bacterium]
MSIESTVGRAPDEPGTGSWYRMSVKRRADTPELVKGGTMNHRSHAGNRLLLPFVFLLFTVAGCQINDYYPDPNFEYRENFLYTRAVSGKTEVFITNVNGTVTVIGVDTVSEARVSGTKIVKDQSEDAAMRHMVDITVDVQESSSALTIRTLQPSMSERRTYQVNYEVMVPSSWKVTVSNVNGNVDIQNFRNSVTSSVVNGIVNATDIAGSVNVNVTNGTISGKVYLPENGACNLSLVNGNVTLLAPRTTSASVSATVTNGSVSVSNFPIVYSTNSRMSVSGIAGAGKGTIRLSSVNGILQLIGF